MSSAKNWNEAHIQGIDALAVVDAAWAQAALHCSIRFMRSAGGAQTPSSRLRSRRSEGDLVSFPPYTFPLLLHHRESSGWLPGIRCDPEDFAITN